MNETNKKIALFALGLFVFTGTYNSIVINSESSISGDNVKFVKRLDELYGVTVPGREVAAAMTWKKLPSTKEVIVQKPAEVFQPISITASAPAAQPTEEAPAEIVAAVQEELSLALVEVVNPKKWQNGVPAGQFGGSLSANNGVIEELNVSLPNGEGVSVSFSELSGNVFEYDLNGELYSGMMYQVDQNAYMVTLTNGPLEGTRLRFSAQLSEEPQPDNQQMLAENNVDDGSFGNDPANTQGMNVEPMNEQTLNPQQYAIENAVQQDQMIQQEGIQAQMAQEDGMQAQMVNMDEQQSM